MNIYVFDGSLDGILTAVFESYERKERMVRLVAKKYHSTGLFGEALKIINDSKKAARVWKGLQARISKSSQKEYYGAFLAEKAEVFQHLFDYARAIFDHPVGFDSNYGNKDVLALSQWAQMVHRERHRMEAFIRFEKSGEGLYCCAVKPDFNVLPLLVAHFRNRYTDQPWLIYDEERHYGIYYDLHSVQEVKLALKPRGTALVKTAEIRKDDKELLYADLWKNYFKSTNIVERKNLKLHIQHVPKRYWRYLTEKMIDI